MLNCSFTYQNDSKWNKFLGKVTVYRDVMWFRGMSCNVLEVHAVSIFIIEPYGGIRLLWNFCVTCYTIECYIPKTVISVFLLFVCLFSWRYNPLWLYFHGPVAGFSLLIFRGFLITHNDAPQSVGLFWTSDQSVTETCTWQHTTLTTDKHPCPWWYSNPQSQQASGRRPTP